MNEGAAAGHAQSKSDYSELTETVASEIAASTNNNAP
jgi:hypothetical protein